MGSITGLKQGKFTSLDNSGQFRVGQTIDPGQAGQALVSGGPFEPSRWDTHTGIIQPLTMGTNITLTSGAASFNGGTADTINSTPYTGTVPISVSVGNAILLSYDEDTLDLDGSDLAVQKVPNTLTINGSVYDGSAAVVLTIPDTQLILADTDPITISTVGLVNTIGLNFDGDTILLDGGELAVDHVPNELTFTGTSTGTFDGSAALSINLTDTNTTYSAGDNITITGPGNDINLESSIEGMVDIEYKGGFFDTTLTGNDYPSKPTVATYLDLISTTNIILPHNCFYDKSEYKLAFNPGIFMPNDDQSYFNIAVEDDSATATHGRVKPLTSSLELVGFITIPSGWRATKALLSVVNSVGTGVNRTCQYQSVTTWGGTGFTTLSFGFANSETTFGTTMDGALDKVLMLKVYTASVSDFVGGGYITLVKL